MEANRDSSPNEPTPQPLTEEAVGQAAAPSEAEAPTLPGGDPGSASETEEPALPLPKPPTGHTGYLKRKHEEKFRKKDPLSWENTLKSITSLTDCEKTAYLSKRYQELYNEHRRMCVNFQALEKAYRALEKEKSVRQGEMAKLVIAKSRLEAIGRELQKQNRQIKEENIAKIKEEEERRKEISSKFSDKLSDINLMMDENKEKSEKLREENLKMTSKLADLYGEFQKREDDISKMSQQLDLERQYWKATLAKMELELKAERELHNKEQLILKSNLEKSEANCAVLIETVKGLQDNIEVYKRQYEDFESSMSKSSKVFDNFKVEIAHLTKQLAALEHEANTYKAKYHDSMKSLIETTEAKNNQELLIQSLDRKNDQLQKLCRQLQTDRTFFLKLLKTNNIELSLPKEPPQDEARKPESPKMTKKEKELELLKENLQAVQNELTKLKLEEKTDQIAAPEESSFTSPVPQGNGDAACAARDEYATGACAIIDESAKGTDVQPGEFFKAPTPEPASKKMVLLDQDRGVREEVDMKVEKPKQED